jgi:tRNA nucleotidyltransferase (CCA-adding enzyme)
MLEACNTASLGLAERYASLVLTTDRPGIGARDRPDVQATDPRQTESKLDARCSARLKVPAACRELARLATLMWPTLRTWRELDAESRLRALELCDALRRPERALTLAQWARTVASVLQASTRDAVADRFAADLTAARSVEAGVVARQALAGSVGAPASGSAERIASALRAARVEALETHLSALPHGAPPR